jgi:hypothetical protein
MRPRREFLKDLLVSGALPGLLSIPARSDALTAFLFQSPTGQTASEVDPQAYEFWTRFAKSITKPVESGARRSGESVPKSAASGRERAGEPASDPGRAPVYLHYQQESGFRSLLDVSSEELLPVDGDAVISVTVDKFKAAEEDRKAFARLQSGQLRLDLLQNKSVTQLTDLLAWSAIAGVLPLGDGTLPSVSTLRFDSPTTWERMQNVLLPGGSGRWAINFSLQARESRWGQVLKVLVKEFGRFAPVLSLPAISVAALGAFSELYAYMHHPGRIAVFETMPILAIATAPGWRRMNSTESVPLVSGEYVLIPRKHYAAIRPRLADLEVRQGYIVPKNTAGDVIDDTALNAARIPDVTYLTLNLTVKPAQASGDCGKS